MPLAAEVPERQAGTRCHAPQVPSNVPTDTNDSAITPNLPPPTTDCTPVPVVLWVRQLVDAVGCVHGRPPSRQRLHIRPRCCRQPVVVRPLQLQLRLMKQGRNSSGNMLSYNCLRCVKAPMYTTCCPRFTLRIPPALNPYKYPLNQIKSPLHPAHHQPRPSCGSNAEGGPVPAATCSEQQQRPPFQARVAAAPGLTRACAHASR